MSDLITLKALIDAIESKERELHQIKAGLINQHNELYNSLKPKRSRKK